MKFAKRLDAECVPEWRPKYIQYKFLKKIIKTIVAAREERSSQDAVSLRYVVLARGDSEPYIPEELRFFEEFEKNLRIVDDFFKTRVKEAMERKTKILHQVHIYTGMTKSQKKKVKRTWVSFKDGHISFKKALDEKIEEQGGHNSEDEDDAASLHSTSSKPASKNKQGKKNKSKQKAEKGDEVCDDPNRDSAESERTRDAKGDAISTPDEPLLNDESTGPSPTKLPATSPTSSQSPLLVAGNPGRDENKTPSPTSSRRSTVNFLPVEGMPSGPSPSSLKSATGDDAEDSISQRSQRSREERSSMLGKQDDDTVSKQLSTRLNGAASPRLDPNYGRHASMRIKKALVEYYRSLEHLKNFQSLNIIACAKILKKFDKNSGRHGTQKYTGSLPQYSFYTSSIVDSLLSDVENIYQDVFAEGDRSKALRKLRMKDTTLKTYYGWATYAGFLGGLSFALVWHLLALINGTDSVVTKSLGLIYYGLLLPPLMGCLFAVNASVWDRMHINYRFIFGLTQHSTLHASEFSAFASTYFFFYVLLVTLSLEGWMDEGIAPMHQPWLVMGIMTALFLWPGNQLFRESRLWMAKVFFRIITAPYFTCKFKDFFINDQYMSMGGTFEVLGMLIFYTETRSTPTSTGIPIKWYVFFIQILPALWRSLQCIRRYRDSKLVFPHLVNLAKYVCSMLVPITVGFYRNYNLRPLWYLAIVVRTISAVFSLSWDIVMDFGLSLRKATKEGELRNLILFKPWAYKFAIIADTIARFLWIIPLARTDHFAQFNGSVLTVILWTVEIFRRFMWNFFRVEYEHTNNCNAFRAAADVPLPYTSKDLFYKDMVEAMSEEQNATTFGRDLNAAGLASPVSGMTSASDAISLQSAETGSLFSTGVDEGVTSASETGGIAESTGGYSEGDASSGRVSPTPSDRRSPATLSGRSTPLMKVGDAIEMEAGLRQGAQDNESIVVIAPPEDVHILMERMGPGESGPRTRFYSVDDYETVVPSQGEGSKKKPRVIEFKV